MDRFCEEWRKVGWAIASLYGAILITAAGPELIAACLSNPVAFNEAAAAATGGFLKGFLGEQTGQAPKSFISWGASEAGRRLGEFFDD